AKGILFGESLQLTMGMMETILVCIYRRKVQDPHEQHRPVCVLKKIDKKRLIHLALVPFLILLLSSMTVLVPT
ncbi:hypothetical protein NPIL_554481, partial [Nephila pilipes]